MAPTSIQLEDDQKFALMKFRRSVHDILKPDHDDQFLLRWLRARNWDAGEAEKMLRNSMEWRKKWEIDTTLKTTPLPDGLRDFIPSGIPGLSKDGTPIIILPFAGFDIWGVLHTYSKKDVMRQVILLLEEYLDFAKNNGTHQVSGVIDMENFNLKQYAWKPATEFVISMIQMYEANYPEILRICYIVNAPSIFSLAYNIVKRFMGEYTINKIQIYKNDPKKWQPILLEHVPAEVLPKYLGGQNVDPDGNPKCPSKIRQGGKVPKEMYQKNQKEEENQYVNETVKKGKQLTIDFIAAEPECVLTWEFRTEDHDIRFGINCRNSEGVEKAVVPIHKVNSHIVPEVGLLNCEYPATYTVVFDNTHSILRNKKVSYEIQCIGPSDKLDVNTVSLPEDIKEEDDTRL